jgi:hypothetical protein
MAEGRGCIFSLTISVVRGLHASGDSAGRKFLGSRFVMIPPQVTSSLRHLKSSVPRDISGLYTP